MIERVVRIENRLGLHARAAARLVKTVAAFEAEIHLGRDGAAELVDGRSIVGILLLAAAKGTELRIVASGNDENEALDAIVSLIRQRFGEEM